MNAHLGKFASRLKCLVLMLSSDQPGEVSAAAQAIKRTLQSVGADWHDLAGLLAAKTPHLPHDDGDDDADWHAMCDFCLGHSEYLRSRELEFINSLDDWRGDLTEKQFVWLSAIHGRVRRHAT